MFEAAESCFLAPAMRRWREVAAQNGFQLDTCDLCPASDADVVWFMDLPRRKRVFDDAKRSARTGVPLVLQVLESPLLFPASYVEANRRPFDAIVSFEFGRDEGRTFAYQLPVEPEPQFEGRPFGERKLAVMVNTNRVEGWLATRKSGWVGLPGVGGYFSGWKMPPVHFLRPAKGELYSWRRSLALAAEATDASRLEIFGCGWSGEEVSWCPGLYAHRYRGHRSSAALPEAPSAFVKKRQWLGHYRFAIASENYRGRQGYISEKIFDAMLGGCVPVYVGEEAITSQVPPGCFVDARKYQCAGELWNHLEGMPEGEWENMRRAAREYLASDAFQAFTSDVFAEKMVKILKTLPTPSQ